MLCVYLGRSNDSTPFVCDTEPLIECCGISALTAFLACLWEVFFYLYCNLLTIFHSGKKINKVKKSEVWQPLFVQRDCWEHKRPVSFSLIVWTKAGQIPRLQLFLSIKSFHLLSMLWKTSGSEQLFPKSPSSKPRWCGRPALKRKYWLLFTLLWPYLLKNKLEQAYW